MHDNYRFLLINTDPAERQRIRLLLQAGIDGLHIDELDNSRRLKKALATADYDLILADDRLTEFDWREVVNE
ncbi:MAG: hypothetical protein O6928_04535 [Gammaproteobacteria bacterium]|nr:hypothetical protein [Gammaproteobacteria bacterium]